MRRSGWLALFLLALGLGTGAWLLRRAAQPVVPLTPTRLFEQVMAHVRRFGVDSLAEAELYRRAADGLLWELDDEHATLVPAGAAVDEFDRPDPGGLGMLLATRDDQVRVLGVLPGSAARRAGMQPGDVLLELDDRPVEANRRDELRKALAGAAGSIVTVSFRRPGITPLAKVSLVRGTPATAVVLPGVELEPGVGHLAVPLLGDGAASRIREAIEDLERAGMRGLVLDLRSASSGDVAEAARVAALFLPKGTEVLRIVGRSQSPEILATRTDPVFPALPLVVVVDSGTADAAEALAGILQEQDRALLVGGPTFGRGQSAETFPLTDRAAVRLSTGRWVTPLGRSIQRDTATTDSLEQRPVMTTPGGRTVRGGGGIVPDSLVRADSLTDGERVFLRALGANLGAFYDSLRAVGSTPGVTPGPAARDRLVAALTGTGPTREQIAGAVAMIDGLLGEIVAEREGGSAAWRMTAARREPVIRLAVGVLRDAGTAAAVVGLRRPAP
ncbi:MAG TPA: S41 family peptidase [Gemmatimonadales bacterium]